MRRFDWRLIVVIDAIVIIIIIIMFIWMVAIENRLSKLEAQPRWIDVKLEPIPKEGK